MRIDKLIKSTIDIFEKWLNEVQSDFKKGALISIVPGYKYSFPNEVIIAESPTHYVIELSGSQNIFQNNSIKLKSTSKIIKVINTTSYINAGFPVKNIEQGTISINFSGNTLIGARVSTDYDKKLFQNKINIKRHGAELKSSSKLNAQIPISISPTADKLILYDVDSIRADKFRLFYRYISTAIVIKKRTSLTNYKNWLNSNIRELGFQKEPHFLGLNLYNDTTQTPFARKLLSLAYESVSEQEIDNFIEKHNQEFAKALGYQNALSKTKLKLIDKKGWTKSELIPDYLMQKADNKHYDILDLKKGLLKYKKLTRGEKSRSRFNSYLNELAGQLYGYDRYFKSETNQNWAKKEKGICVDNPLLIGIVGNHNNFLREEIDMALEQYKDNLIILSYNELFNLLRINN